MNAIIAATVLGIIMMYAGFMAKEKKALLSVATLALVVLLGVNVWELFQAKEGNTISLFNFQLTITRFSLWFNTLMTAATLLYVLLMGNDILKVGKYTGEYFALFFFILTGTYLLSSFNNLLIMFIGIEIISIPQYILAGADKKNLKSSEASLKYFLMGSFSTGILLMGITLIYGATGDFNISKFSFLQMEHLNPMVLSGVLFLIVAFAFKVSAAPMHFWTPDVYDGSPTPFTAFMATIGKAAAFIGFIRLFHTSFASISDAWMTVLAIVTAATLFIGNITAVFQQSVKRMLAYSSIAQAGFMLFSVVSVSALAWQGLLVYAVAYTVATLGMFAVLLKLKDYTFDGFNGLAKKEPVLAFTATIFTFSLAGIPLTAGFMAKFYMLQAAVRQGNLMWLVIFSLIMAAVSAYYYFRVVIAMYFKTGEPQLHAEVSSTDKFLLVLTAALVILLGVAPQLLLPSGI
ncbi:NADH-quinone oxidoreductase subunit N [Rurimicrobium arvi]|uniref:NADH-quinone oxidoreductase subunit N n=1 Tax=Rurimicrobium arvi TaxID=2049916 RepID=A0ABP8MIX0_9BACT